jgi:protease I
MKRIGLVSLALVFLASGFLTGKIVLGGEGKPLAGKKVALVIASEKFRDEEFKEPRNLLIQAGAMVLIVSSKLTEATGMLGMKVKPDVLLQDLKPQGLAAVLFIGGVGASEYFHNPDAHVLAQEVLEQGGVVGAICIAPVTLARAGLLQGKRATVFKSEKEELTRAGASYTGNPVEIDGRIITGNGPAAAKGFAEAVVKLLEQKK